MPFARLSGAAAVSALLCLAAPARATNVTEFPDNGSEQMGRGGAWMVRASDPLATAFNPAGLAGQPTRLTLQNNTIFHHTCFTRVQAFSDKTQEPLADPNTGVFPRVCNDISPTVNPQLAMTYAVTPRLGLGLAVLGPSSGGEKQFPEFVDSASGPQAPPNRYLLIREAGIILFPTLGVGYEVLDNLRLGASVSWGVAKLKLANANVSLNTDGSTPASDVRANLQVRDYFIPGFSLGAIYGVTERVEVAGFYKWTDAIRARGDVGTAANWYTRQNAGGDESRVRYGDTIFSDCGTGLPNVNACGGGDNAEVKFVIPMEAKIGVRYHVPRQLPSEIPDKPTPASPKHRRDPLANDLFDVEVNLTWANNSAADTVQARFPGDPSGNGILPVSGIPGSSLPPNADQPRGYKDVIGVRVGGDVNVLPDKLALRAGGFFETNGQDRKYQNLDFAGSSRVGFGLGGTYRIHLGSSRGSTSALELMIGYGHVFFGTQRNDDRAADGVPALAGTPCNPADAQQPGPTCTNGTQKYRSNWPVNLGTITNAVNVINAGVSYRF
jgi:hypothetical protein